MRGRIVVLEWAVKRFLPGRPTAGGLSSGARCHGSVAIRIGIVGCGPAGLAAALLLDRDGHAVTLLERFPAPAPVGSGLLLQPTGLAVLAALGLEQQVRRCGQRINRLLGRAMPSGRAVLDVRYERLARDAHAVAVHRSALFDALHGSVQARALPVHCGIDVANARRDIREVFALDEGGVAHGPFDLLVDASGSGSKLRDALLPSVRRIELGYGALWGNVDWPGESFSRHVLAQRYVGAHTMIGVLPIGRPAPDGPEQAAFFWSLRRRDLDAWRAAGLPAWKQRVRDIWPRTEPILEQLRDPDQLTFARYAHHTLGNPGAARVAFIGDAAHATSPQLGQGVNMALLDALALAQALSETADANAALDRYAALRRWHVRVFQFASRMLTGFYQSDSRTLALMRDYLLAPALRLRPMHRLAASLVSGLFLNPLGRLDLNERPLPPAKVPRG